MSKPSVPVKTGTIPLLLPDAASTAALAVAQAMEFCARKMGLAGAEKAIEVLRRGDRAACSYCHYSLAQRVGESLGALDEGVKAVYLFEYDEDMDEEYSGHTGVLPPLHLIAHVDGKTATLSALVDGLERALVEAVAGALGLNPAASVLDVHLVDDRDVERRVGYGALLSALYNRPIRVWAR